MLTSRLLILNQKEAECKEMAAYFQDSGYSVIWCTEYDEATEILSRGKNKPDLLIFDQGEAAADHTESPCHRRQL